MVSNVRVLPYNNQHNVIKLADGRYAVLKYLLRQYYYPLANEPQRQLKTSGMHYVLFGAEEILPEIESLTAPHVMDGYNYPMDGYNYPEYPIDMSPYPQQLYTARVLMGNTGQGDPVNNGKGYHLHSSMRTGKTLSCLWAVDFALKNNIFQKVLVAAPKTVVRSTWAKELSKHFMGTPYTIRLNSKRSKLSKTRLDIINHDGLTILIKKNLIFDYDLIIYDECTMIKTIKTNRWVELNKYLWRMNLSCRMWLLTGTPLAQSPLSAYGLAKIISPNLVPRTFTMWRSMTMYNEWGHKWLPRREAAEICAQALRPSTRFELKDIDAIPNLCFEYIICEKSGKQNKMFRQLAQEYVTEYETQGEQYNLMAGNAASKTSKLLQILSGVVYNEEHQGILTDAAPRLDALTDLIDQLPESQPIVIFADWSHTQELLKKHLEPLYKTVEVINGKTNSNERFAIEQRVQRCETKVVIVQSKVGALGLDFSSTNIIVWFTVTFKAELYQQGNDRIRNYSSRLKGFDKFIIYNMVSDPVEQAYYESLKGKLLTQEDFFKIIKQGLTNDFII